MYHRQLNAAEKKQLQDFLAALDRSMGYYAGFPPNTQFDYSELFPFLGFPINNLGDPLGDRTNPHSSHAFECEVLQYMAQLFNAPSDFSGYVTNGGTEGNLYGLYLARKAYPKAMVYYSAHAHYSIVKNLDLLQMPYQVVAVQAHGEMDYDDLERQISFNKDKGAIVLATLGTTVLGAIDNIRKIKRSLYRAGVTDHFIHADAAFSGMVLPFVDDPQPYQFSDGVDCISVSGHKFIGSPIPCGVVITKKSFIECVRRDAGYFSGHKIDTTISGSRNGITPLFLWYAIKRQGDVGFKKLVDDGFAKVNYAIDYFSQQGILAWSNKNSLMIAIPQLSENLLKKWAVPAGYGYSSLCALPKLTYEMIHEICSDMIKENLR